MKYVKLLLIIISILMFLVGCKNKDLNLEQTIISPDINEMDKVIPSATEEYANMTNKEKMLSYISLKDGYYIKDYGETMGENYSYFVYQMEQIEKVEDRINMYWEIVVMRKEHVITVLRVENEEYGDAFFEPSEMVIESDVNFDDKNDILICLGHFGNQGAIAYKCFLDIDGAFVHCPSFTEIANPSMDKANQAIRSYWRNSAASHGWGIYKYLEDEFIMTECLTEEAHLDKNEALVWTWKDEIWVNNRWLVRDYVTEKNFDSETMNNKFYGSDSYWGIDQEWWQMNLEQKISLDYEKVEDIPEGESDKENLVEKDPENSLKKQLQVISNYAGLWLIPKYRDSSVYCQYVVTDLDQNGRLELISSYILGSGHYAENYYYEVNEALNGLTMCEKKDKRIDLEPTIMVECVPVYYDFEHNVYYYIFDEARRDGIKVSYQNRHALSFKDGQLSDRTLAYKTVWHEDSSDAIMCEDEDRNTISETEYNRIADTIFPDFIKKEVNLLWFQPNSYDADRNNVEDDTLMDMLLKSYEGFVIQ